MNDWEIAAQSAVQEPKQSPPFTFRRFVAGSERAQDVAVHREITLDAAMRVAAKICPPSESGHPTVLVYTPPAATVQEPVRAWQIFGEDNEPLFIQQDEASAKRYAEAGHRVERLGYYTTPPAAPVPLTDEQASDMPDCWVVVKNGRIIATHDEPCHHDGIQAVRYAPAAPVQPVAWQPIASAPKDGTRILCQDEKGLVDICEWTQDRFTSSDDRTFGGCPAYTSWMPLPHSEPTPPAAPVQEPVEVDQATMELAESVGLIGPASRTHDLHAAIQRFHDLICVNATIKAAKMAADAISESTPPAAPVQEPVEFEDWHSANYVQPLEKYGDSYKNMHVRNRWQGWLGAKSTPPAAQRQWVVERLAIAIKAKLKEKNT